MQKAIRSIMIARRKICGADTPLGRPAGFAGTLPATPLATLSLRAKPRSSLALRVMIANDIAFLPLDGRREGGGHRRTYPATISKLLTISIPFRVSRAFVFFLLYSWSKRVRMG
jgi:hypothetical protein